MLFPPYQTALQLSHVFIDGLWPGAQVVDATLGNGNDTRILAGKVGETGHVWAFDIQEEAIARCRTRIASWDIGDRVTLIHDSHHHIRQYIHSPLDCVVFNLGWLPGDDRPPAERTTTQWETTRIALSDSLTLLNSTGLLLVCIYPGHEEGAHELQGLQEWSAALDNRMYSAMWMHFPNHAANAPHLLLVQRMV